MADEVDEGGDWTDVGAGKACSATRVSMRWEKRLLRRSVCMRVKVGESMRSAVSSRR